MRRIKVELGKNSYEVHIGANLFSQSALWLKECGYSGKVVIIADRMVNGLYGEKLSNYLTDNGFKVNILQVTEGEEQKSLETAGRLYHELTEVFAERTTPILALGGGVIGDLAGFVAATYMRGIPLIQIPTTLLAQVDSSIGGKVAVDHGRLKNKIGTFYQPGLVIADIGTLKTLPPHELSNGLAEVIKSACIRDKNLFTFIEQNLDSIKALDEKALEEIVFNSVRIKAEVVEKDERDMGLRGILNYGHTIGHAIETVTDFSMAHGTAVAIGMVAAAKISNRMGILEKDDVNRIENVIGKVDLPTEIPDIDIVKVMQAMKYDKKVLHDKVRFVLLKSIGNAFITDEVDSLLVEKVLSGAS